MSSEFRDADGIPISQISISIFAALKDFHVTSLALPFSGHK